MQWATTRRSFAACRSILSRSGSRGLCRKMSDGSDFDFAFASAAARSVVLFALFAGIRDVALARRRCPCAGRHLLFFAAAKKSRQKKAAHTANSCFCPRTSTAPCELLCGVSGSGRSAAVGKRERVLSVSGFLLPTFFAAAKKVRCRPAQGHRVRASAHRGCRRRAEANKISSLQSKESKADYRPAQGQSLDKTKCTTSVRRSSNPASQKARI